MQKKPKNIDSYISQFPGETQKLLEQLRAAIHAAAPEATETISYQMPAFELNGVLVWFAAYSKHIGFYPKASGIAAFEKELSRYEYAKGSVQFPLTEPLPVRLIARIVKFRVRENLRKKLASH